MIFVRSYSVMLIVAAAFMVWPAWTARAQNTTSPSQNDRKFVRSALEGGVAEVELSQMAVANGSSDDVKQFGQKIIADQTKMEDQMRNVAQQEGISAPPGPTGREKALQDKLKTLSGPSFDRAYIEAMVKDHREDLDAFNKEANHGNDTAIKDVASEGARVIGEHLEMIKQLARTHNVDTVQ